MCVQEVPGRGQRLSGVNGGRLCWGLSAGRECGCRAGVQPGADAVGIDVKARPRTPHKLMMQYMSKCKESMNGEQTNDHQKSGWEKNDLAAGGASQAAQQLNIVAGVHVQYQIQRSDCSINCTGCMSNWIAMLC